MSCSSVCGVVGSALAIYLLTQWITKSSSKKNYKMASMRQMMNRKLHERMESPQNKNVDFKTHILRNDPELSRMMRLHRENIDQHWKNLLNEEGNINILNNQFRLNRARDQWGTGQEVVLGNRIVGPKMTVAQQNFRLGPARWMPAVQWHRYGIQKGMKRERPVYKASFMFPKKFIHGVKIQHVPHYHTLMGIQMINANGRYFHYNLSNIPNLPKDGVYLPIPEKTRTCRTPNAKCITPSITFIYRREPKYMPLMLYSVSEVL